MLESRTERHTKLIDSFKIYYSALSQEERTIFDDHNTRPIIVERLLITEEQKQSLHNNDFIATPPCPTTRFRHIGSPSLITQQILPQIIQESTTKIFTVSETVACSLDCEWCKRFRQENPDVLFIVSHQKNENRRQPEKDIELPTISEIHARENYETVIGALTKVAQIRGVREDLFLAYQLIYETRSNDDLLRLLEIGEDETFKFWAYINRNRNVLNGDLDKISYPLDLYDVRKALIYVKNKRSQNYDLIQSCDKRTIISLEYAIAELFNLRKRFPNKGVKGLGSILHDINELTRPKPTVPIEHASETKRVFLIVQMWQKAISLFGNKLYQEITATLRISEDIIKQSIIGLELYCYGLNEEVMERLTTYPFDTEQNPIMNEDEISELKQELIRMEYINNNATSRVKGVDLATLSGGINSRQGLFARIDNMVINTALAICYKYLTDGNIVEANRTILLLQDLFTKNVEKKATPRQRKRYQKALESILK